MPRVYERECDKCGKEYRGEGARFCSTKCAENIKKYALCKQCEKEFHKCKDRMIFCSKECTYLWRTIHKKKKRKLSLVNSWKQLLPEQKHHQLRNHCKKRKLSVCGKEEFLEWYRKQVKICVYCSIPEEYWEMIRDTKITLGKPWLTIDRKNNNDGYYPDNMVFACMRCNLVKSSQLTYNEMKEIGQKYIKPKWQILLKEVKVNV